MQTKPFTSQNYVVLDIETTGFYFEVFDEIIEIAAIRLENGVKGEVFHEYIRPYKEVPKKIQKLTGITNEQLKDKPRFMEVLPRLMDFIGDSIVVAYNKDFDINFINHYIFKLRERGQDIKPILKSACSYTAFKKIVNRNKNAKLIDACDHFGVSLENAHSAIDDTAATLEVFKEILKIQDENLKKNIVEIEQKTYKEVYVYDLKRVLNSRPKQKVKNLLIKDANIVDDRRGIETEEDKKKLIKYFFVGSMFPIISTETNINETAIQDFFLEEYVNNHNINSYKHLVEKDVVDMVLKIFKIADNDLDEVYAIHQEIFSKSKKKGVTINTFLYRLIKKLYIDNNISSNVNQLDSYRLFFESGKTLEEILSLEETKIGYVDLANIFAIWLSEDLNNREVYRSYISDNILKLTELKELINIGYEEFVRKYPNLKAKACLTNILYENSFFKL